MTQCQLLGERNECVISLVAEQNGVDAVGADLTVTATQCLPVFKKQTSPLISAYYRV